MWPESLEREGRSPGAQTSPWEEKPPGEEQVTGAPRRGDVFPGIFGGGNVGFAVAKEPQKAGLEGSTWTAEPRRRMLDQNMGFV